MNRRKVGTWLFAAALLLLCSLLPASALADDDDPPGRVARMNYSHGSVSFQPGGEGEWVEAVPNRPMTTGDNLWTDRDSRAELHVGSTAIRLNGETSLTFLGLDDRNTQLRLAQGSVVVHVRHLDDEDTLEIDTPNIAFQIQHVGEYRVDVDPDGRSTIVDVFEGRGDALGGGNNYTIVARQHATFRGGGEGDQQPLDYEIDRLPANDDFDNWCLDRDRHEDRSESASYVSREMTGYEDLDDWGHWTYAAAYGHVWVPTRVDPDWAPYREGHWAFIAPWGWTWVDDEPWGFAPFHYGRWCRIGPSWGWIPGPVVLRPVYAPALVAYVGGGGFHLSGGLGGGSGVAWFPLGPGEVFVPSYHVSRNYVNQVNVTNTVVNVTQVTNVYNTTIVNNNVNRVVYVNQNAPHAVTAVSRDTFINARPVSRNVVQISQKEIDQAPVARITGVEPIRTSVMGLGRATRVAPPQAVATRQVVALRPPAPATVPLAQRQDPLVARPARPAMQHGPNQPVAVPPNSGQNNAGQTMPQHQTPARPERYEGGVSGPGSAAQKPEVPRPDNPGAEFPRQNVPRPDAQKPDVQRPAAPRPDVQPAPSAGEDTRPQRGWSQPLARPAAPAQPKSPQEGRDEERKFQQWQQKQQRSAPAPPPAKRNDQPREEKPRDKKNP